MKELEISARTVEEAIQLALEQLGISREEVAVTVLSEGRSGIFGLGTEEARVRVRSLVATSGQESDIVEVTKGVLETLLTKLGVVASVVPQAQTLVEDETVTSTPVTFDISGDDLGILIGRRGETLACLQYMVRLIVGQQTKTWVLITIDVEGYKRRRYEALRALAQRLAERVKVGRKPFTLEPMLSYERRIIHLALADHPDVTTESTGQGDNRKVVILPKEQPSH